MSAFSLLSQEKNMLEAAVRDIQKNIAHMQCDLDSKQSRIAAIDTELLTASTEGKKSLFDGVVNKHGMNVYKIVFSGDNRYGAQGFSVPLNKTTVKLQPYRQTNSCNNLCFNSLCIPSFP